MKRMPKTLMRVKIDCHRSGDRPDWETVHDMRKHLAMILTSAGGGRLGLDDFDEKEWWLSLMKWDDKTSALLVVRPSLCQIVKLSLKVARRRK